LLTGLLSAFLLLGLMTGLAEATQETFTIGSMREVTRTVNATLSGNMTGSFSSLNGTIDFFITDPDNSVLLSCNGTMGSRFNLTFFKRGEYTMHFSNPESYANKTVKLDYGVSYIIVIQDTLRIAESAGVAVVTAAIPPPFPWEFLITIFTALLAILKHDKIIEGLAKLVRWLFWWKKYRKSRTPVVINPK